MTKPTVTICHLYPEAMSIYGDRGNVIALQQRLKWHGIEPNLTKINVGEALPKEVDIYFFGGGQDQGQKVVSDDLKSKAERLKDDMESGVVALTVCGGFQLFCDYYQDASGEKIPGIGIFDAYTKASNKRMIGNLLVETRRSESGDRSSEKNDLTSSSQLRDSRFELIGFENHSGQTFLGSKTQPLAKVVKGFGNNGEDQTEGAVYKNALGTYLHGSLLPKNPKLTDFLIQLALARKYPDFKLTDLDDELEKAAFNEAKSRFR